MRVHELADSIGITKADLAQFLEGLGEKGHHLSQVSPEAELLARDHFVDANKMPYEAVPVTDEDQAKFEVEAEEFAEWESQQVWTDPEYWSTDGEVREVDTPGIDPDLPAATGDHVPVPEADRITLLADNGAYRGTLCFDPSTAEKLRAALRGRSVADATLHPARGELVAVTWPDYQKLVVRLDE